VGPNIGKVVPNRFGRGEWKEVARVYWQELRGRAPTLMPLALCIDNGDLQATPGGVGIDESPH